MFKFAALVFFVCYAAFCIGTMPRQCWELGNVITCQRIQISAIDGMRTINWDFVHTLRRI